MLRYFQLASVLLLLLSSWPVLSVHTGSRVNDVSGLPEVLNGGKTIVKGRYLYFAVDDNDKWIPAVQENRFEVISDYNYRLLGENETFGYTLDKVISRDGNSGLNYRLEFNVERDLPRVVGGGIEFRLDSDYNRILGTPRLLPSNRGWIWGDKNGQHFKFEFERPLKKVYFEKGDANIIRCFFFLESISKSVQIYQAKFSFSKFGRLLPSNPERFGVVDFDHWFQYDDPTITPVDLGFLNHRPAGRHGFLQTRGDELVFADGTRTKFWGTNIAARALFNTPLDEIPEQARRIGALGFNLVRIHHHDSYWVNPNAFGLNPARTTELDDEYMTFIDKWIAELNKRGIYIWFDLHTQRYLTASDGITAFDEIEKQTKRRKGLADIKGYAYVNVSIQQAMETINRQFITRVNKFTGQKYANNPGIAVLMLTNENDITQHFANRLLPSKDVPYHTRRYLAEARDYADHWALPYEQVWRSWESGPSKLFLNDLEYRFNRRLIESLRHHDENHLVATTSTWGKNPLYSLPALTGGDVIDVHSYGEVRALEKNPVVTPNFTHWIAAAQVTDMPVSVSEWNLAEFPVADRHQSPLLMGAMAAHQGWDAIMQFGYATQRPSVRGAASNWAMYNDPALLGMMPAAALMYRADHVQQAQQVFLFAPSRDELVYDKLSPHTSVALRSLAEKGKLQIALPEIEELPWMAPGRLDGSATIVRDPSYSIFQQQATRVTSDTGELTRDWSRGTYTVDTPKTQAAAGWIGGEVIELKDVQLAIETRSASVAVQALDNKSIEFSQNIFISVAARAIPIEEGKAPILAEPVVGQLRIRASPGMKLLARNYLGETRELPLDYEQGVYRIDLTRDMQGYWLNLRKSS